MHLFYQANLALNTIILSEEESKHCVKVLRLKNGDIIHLADGNGTHAKAIITNDNPKRCELRIQTKEAIPKSGNHNLHIALAPTKNNERIEWFIEKAVEAGIDEISFIETANTERSKINLERCEKIAISAMKQSKQWYLPKINTMIPLNQFIEKENNGIKLISWCETLQTDFIAQHILKEKANQKIIVLIGPEGDFTTTEIMHATKFGYIPVSLGNTILRTETAALFVCMSVKTLLT